MEPFKILSLRLPAELLEQVDEYAERVGGEANRSVMLRSLIEAGLEKSHLDNRVSALETSLARMMVVIERTYQLSYLNARVMNDASILHSQSDGVTDGHGSTNKNVGLSKERRAKIFDEAAKQLTETLVDQFGY